MLSDGFVQAGGQFIREATTVPFDLEEDSRLVPDYAQEVFFHQSLDGGIIEERPQKGDEEETPLSSAPLIYDNNRRRNITLE